MPVCGDGELLFISAHQMKTLFLFVWKNGKERLIFSEVTRGHLDRADLSFFMRPGVIMRKVFTSVMASPCLAYMQLARWYPYQGDSFLSRSGRSATRQMLTMM